MESRSLLSERASTIFRSIDFAEDADDFYNLQAPAPIVSFVIGGIFSGLVVLYWIVYRYQNFHATVKDPLQSPFMTCRSLIATIADNDDPAFTILRVAAQSMLLLGGFQLNFKATFLFMLAYFTLISLSDSIRVFLALAETEFLSELVVVSKRDKVFLIKSLKMIADNRSTMEVETANVYENISRNFVVVTMVFVTQSILISFVVLDVYMKERMTTLSGTADVPIVGTLGSWCFYVLGIFMQCVYLLGPNTSFGTSEQNPHFWLTLLLAAKKSGAHCQWYNATTDAYEKIRLQPGDVRLWIRFVMSFLINGVGFHILVHALPIQMAGMSSYTGIVFRAVGMMYLTNLDDAPATTLQLMELNTTNTEQKISKKEDEDDKVVTTPTLLSASIDHTETAQATEMVLEKARLQARLLQTQLASDLNNLALYGAASQRTLGLGNTTGGDSTESVALA